jgi:hypothetical protein
MGDEVKAAAERVRRCKSEDWAIVYGCDRKAWPEAAAAALHERDLSVLADAHLAAGWRPIESAPRDGTRVLLGWQNGVRVEIGWWGPKRSQYGVNYGDAWGIGERWDNAFAVQPTHFMLLPAPPA